MERVLFLLFLIIGCTSTEDILDDILSFEDPSQTCISTEYGEIPSSIDLETPIVFYNHKYSVIFVNAPGLITFDQSSHDPYYLSDGTSIPPNNTEFSFLTPFWSFPTMNPACYWKTTNSTIIDRFDDLLQIQGRFSEFRPSLLLVATWKEVQFSTPLKNATFLAILATDGQISFSRFLYGPINGQIDYLIGFNAGDGRGLQLAKQTGPLTPEQEDIVGVSYRIDGNCVTPSTSSCDYSSFAVSCTPLPNITANCSCREGFTAVPPNSCQDIDECIDDEQHNCTDMEMCFNTLGSYKCCILGHHLNKETGNCEKNSPPTTAYTTSAETGQPHPTALVVGLPVGICLVLIGFVMTLSVFLLWRKNRCSCRYGAKMQDFEPIRITDEISGPTLKNTGTMMELVNLPKELKIPFKDLKIDSKIVGEGEFGIVYKAKYRNEVVALKLLKGISGRYTAEQVLEEVMKMKHFSHDNILSLTGVAIDHNSSPCIVMPYMWNGSLDTFLKREINQEKFWITLDSKKADDEVDNATVDLLEICQQIAQGMAYLASEKIVHRDLAARNCMVALNNVIKVADFGLSIYMPENKDYFRLSDDEKLPVKWMAVESLADHKFSEASDVWSYGITCWEIFSGGRKPYPGINYNNIYHEVTEGYRMDKPPNRACSDSVYAIMRSCWKSEPKDRPSFTDLVTEINSLLYDLRDYLPVIDSQDNSIDDSSCESSPDHGYQSIIGIKKEIEVTQI